MTTWFYRQPGRFRIVNHAAEPAYDPRLKLAVDTAEDLEFANWLAAHAEANADLATLAAVAAERLGAPHA